MPPIRPRPRGATEQHGRRPLRGAGPIAASVAQGPCGPGWSFRMKQKDACASLKLSSWPCGRHGAQYSPSPSQVSGCPLASLPAGAIAPRPSTERGRTIKYRSVARLVTAIRSLSFCQARPGAAAERQGRQQPPARFQPAGERPRRTPGNRQYNLRPNEGAPPQTEFFPAFDPALRARV